MGSTSPTDLFLSAEPLHSGPDRLLPRIVDFNAELYPSRTYATFPRNGDLENGFQKLNFRNFANAINRAAWWLDLVLGPKAEDFETFAYIGSKDIRYSILAVAAIKTGRKVLFPSPFSSPQGLLSLLKTTRCNQILRATPFSTISLIIEVINREKDLRVQDMLSLEELLDPQSVSKYSYNKSYLEAENDPFMIIHTSGTTGDPKPLFYTNGCVAAYDAQRYMPEDNGPLWWHLITGKTIFSPMPTLHVAGIFTSLILPLFFDAHVVLGPGTRPLSADLVEEVHKQVPVDGGLYPPSILEEMCKSTRGLEVLTRLEFVMYTGAPLSRSAGDILSRHIKVHSTVGSTEVGVFPVILSSSEDWNYFHFHPYFGYEMKLHGESGGYELILHRDPALHSYQSVFHLYPQSKTYHTKDLFIPHPTKPDLWKYQGRIDDLIILSHGEDLNPVEMEKVISQDPSIRAVVIGGKGRNAPFAIVERVDQTPVDEKDRNYCVSQLWPSFIEANRKCSRYVQLQQSHIIFTSPDKPLLRTLKGSIDRRKSLMAYESEIDGLFASLE